jgi:ketosteroid isomerase-like protein
MSRLIFVVTLGLIASTCVIAQNSNSSTTVRPRTTTNTNANTNQAASQTTKPADTQKPKTTTTPKTTDTKTKGARTAPTPSASVIDTFNKLLEGIRHTDVTAVTDIYWNSPKLVLFNNNGSLTKGWEQLKRNREASYAEMKDVKLDVRDISVIMLGRDGAVVSCLWTQSQTARGVPETASGRMTLVFKRVGKDWKAVHLHTSPDAPNPARILPSERVASPTPSP